MSSSHSPFGPFLLGAFTIAGRDATLRPMGTHNSNNRIHGTGLVLACLIAPAMWGAAYVIDGWHGVAVLAGVSALVAVGIVLDDRHYRNQNNR